MSKDELLPKISNKTVVSASEDSTLPTLRHKDDCNPCAEEMFSAQRWNKANVQPINKKSPDECNKLDGLQSCH